MINILPVVCALFGALQVVLGLINPSNYRVLRDEEGIRNGAYNLHAFVLKESCNINQLFLTCHFLIHFKKYEE